MGKHELLAKLLARGMLPAAAAVVRVRSTCCIGSVLLLVPQAVPVAVVLCMPEEKVGSLTIEWLYSTLGLYRHCHMPWLIISQTDAASVRLS